MSRELFVSARVVKAANQGRLPDWGRECLVVVDGVHYWAQRNPFRFSGKPGQWWLRETSWRLENGVAVLRAENIAGCFNVRS
jgi:hypothetical protein